MQLSLFPEIIPNQFLLFPHLPKIKKEDVDEAYMHEPKPPVVYPESDGKPMAENTEHFDLLTMIKSALDVLFEDDPEVFVAGDLLWYPVKGNPRTKVAPDVMVAKGRPKGRRGAYVQHREGDIAPQVIFEILSPGNTSKEMRKKHHFYSKHGVVEYFMYNTKNKEVTLFIRVGEYLVTALPFLNNHSALLNIRLEVIEGELKVVRPDGSIALTYSEQHQQWQKVEKEIKEEKQARLEAQQEAKAERLEKERAKQEVEAERLEKERAKQEAEAERLEKERAKQEAEAERLEKERALKELEILRAMIKKRDED